MKKSTVLFCLLITMCLVPLSAQVGAKNQSSGDIAVTVRYQDKTVYYPNSPVLVKVSIKNNGTQPYTFQLAEETALNLDIKVKTLTNQLLDPSDALTARLVGSHAFLYRLMELRSGEEYSFVVDLRQFVSIPKPGSYVVETSFIPYTLATATQQRQQDLASHPTRPSDNDWESYLASQTQVAMPAEHNVNIVANSLSLDVRPISGKNSVLVYGQASNLPDVQEALQREDLSPEQVMNYTLAARQANEWNKYFLYMNIESLYLNNTDRARPYMNADPVAKLAMQQEYRNQLMGQNNDMEIATLPYSYKILSVYYSQDRAYVVTRQVYREKQFDEVRKYTWFLRKENGIWVIYNYEVMPLGTQKASVTDSEA